MPPIISVIIATLVAIFCGYMSSSYFIEGNIAFGVIALLFCIFNIVYAFHKALSDK